MGDQQSDLNEASNAITGPKAYVAVRNAECFYEPHADSPIRIVPPFNSEVDVLRKQGDWIQIRFFTKEAWCEQEKLSNLPNEVMPPQFDIRPFLFPASYVPASHSYPQTNVEYGPRGGRFTRTRTGHRRYF